MLFLSLSPIIRNIFPYHRIPTPDRPTSPRWFRPAQPNNMMAPHEKPADDVVQHQEGVDELGNHPSKDLAVVAAAKGQTTTGYESMTVWETIKTFKMSCLVCFAAAFSAATDGYQIA